MSTRCWGEHFSMTPSKVGLSAVEKKKLANLPRPLPLEGPKIHQPSTFDRPSQHYLQPTDVLADPLVLNGVQLLVHRNKALDALDNHRDDQTAPLMPMPDVTSPKRSVVTDGPFGYVAKRQTDFTAGKPRVLPQLSKETTRKALLKSVAAVCAFYGFENTEEHALEVLTDVTGDYLNKMCSLMRTRKDLEHAGGNAPFPDLVEAVFHDMNIGSVLNIQKFYEQAVIKRHRNIVADTKSAIDSLNSLSSTDPKEVFPAEMDEGNNDNIPEIHFPSSEEGDGDGTLNLDHAGHTLETGLQMLQSLEQGGLVGIGSQQSGDHSEIGGEDLQQPLSHDSNSALLLATVSPGPNPMGSRKRRKTSDRTFL